MSEDWHCECDRRTIQKQETAQQNTTVHGASVIDEHANSQPGPTIAHRNRNRNKRQLLLQCWRHSHAEQL